MAFQVHWEQPDLFVKIGLKLVHSAEADWLTDLLTDWGIGLHLG